MKIGEADLIIPGYQDSHSDGARKKMNALLQSVEGTYPMNRSYGISSEIIDCPLPVAQVMLAKDIYEKSEHYIKEVNVMDISFRIDDEADILYPVIYAEDASRDDSGSEIYDETESWDSEEDEYESD